jgi:EAL domain-containing protein (putative c-di-GMP-specific phosphodiesterase class I)
MSSEPSNRGLAVPDDVICHRNDVVVLSSLVFILDGCGNSVGLSSLLCSSGKKVETFHACSELVEGLRGGKPELILIEVLTDSTDAIDAIFALSQASYSGAVRLMSTSDVTGVEGVKRMGERLSLRMLPTLIRPLDDSSIAEILNTGGPRESGNLPPQVNLDHALRNEWVEFWYQPKIDLRTKYVVGAEVLARVRHPTHGVIFPHRFLPGANEWSLIALNEQALIHALRGSTILCRMGVKLRLAVNFSVNALKALPVAQIVREHRPTMGKWPGLIFDVTEKEIADDIWTVHEIAASLSHCGIDLAIDEYGGGKMSMAALRKLPFGELKLNRAFVAGCSTDSTKAAICKTVIDLVHSLDGRAVAIGVEKASDVQALQRMTCDIGQGYLFGQPMPEGDFVKLLYERAKLHQRSPWANRIGSGDESASKNAFLSARSRAITRTFR